MHACMHRTQLFHFHFERCLYSFACWFSNDTKLRVTSNQCLAVLVFSGISSYYIDKTSTSHPGGLWTMRCHFSVFFLTRREKAQLQKLMTWKEWYLVLSLSLSLSVRIYTPRWGLIVTLWRRRRWRRRRQLLHLKNQLTTEGKGINYN